MAQKYKKKPAPTIARTNCILFSDKLHPQIAAISSGMAFSATQSARLIT